MINKTIKFKENEYQLKYPSVGQLIDIRVIEQQISKGTAKDLLTGLNADVDSYIYITTMAHIQVLLPELVKDLKVPMRDLDISDFQELIDLFSDEISPWLTEWRDKMKDKIKQKSE